MPEVWNYPTPEKEEKSRFPGKIYLKPGCNLQEYAQQAAYQALEQKQADSVSIILMRPGNGEILAMVNVPEYDLNDPFNLKKSTKWHVTAGNSG